MTKISYLELQKKYPELIVALSKDESEILAVGEKMEVIIAKLQKANIDPANCIFVGPVQKHETTSVYQALPYKILS